VYSATGHSQTAIVLQPLPSEADDGGRRGCQILYWTIICNSTKYILL
jgi:hypothetical protein